MHISLQHQQGSCFIDVTFHSKQDNIIALFGSSGAGKTSIINMIAGLQKPDKGSIYIRERYIFNSAQNINLPPEKRNIGYVFQESLLFPHLSVKNNLLYGKNRKNSTGNTIDFNQVIDLLGIQELLTRKPKTLSGGEKQRVAFGRAVLSNPDILLMDEPLASLDSARRKEILPFIKKLNTHFRIPILYVSHSLEEILTLTDCILKLKNGKLVENT